MQKNSHNVRFLRNCQKIRHSLNQAYRRHVANICVRQLTRQAKVGKSSFYNRYHNINDAVRQIELDLIHDFRRVLHRISHQNPNLTTTYTTLLSFIQHHYEDFDAAIERQNYGLIVAMLNELHPLITHHWPQYRPEIYQQLFYLYAGEAAFTIVNWVKQTKCHQDTISICVEKLVRISQTTPHRFRELGPAQYSHPTTIPEIKNLLAKMHRA